MTTNNRKVVTRFAPSPTGFMHVGGVRTALFAWLFARKNNGTFILRIEDTDKAREVEGSAAHIIEALRWLGLEWNEGVDIGGPHAPYLQSKRLDSYIKYTQILLEKGLAYPDPYTEEELEVLRKKAEDEKRPFLFRDHRPEVVEKWDGKKPVRFKVPEIKRYEWHDMVYGDLSAGPEALDDFILIKGDGYPTYNLAHIIDDLEMGVTHVIRGNEFISSVPKFLALYDALEIPWPTFATLPPIMAPDGKKKLGKRDGAKDMLAYRDEGYLPNAMMNFLAYLGWNPGDEREIMTPSELIESFSLERIHHAGAKLNDEKLDWTNKEHIKLLSNEEFSSMASKFVPDAYKSKLAPGPLATQIFAILKERITKFIDVKNIFENGEFDFFFDTPSYDFQILIPKKGTKESTKAHFGKLIELLSGVEEHDWTVDSIKNAVWDYASEMGRGEVLAPMRVALSGLLQSPDPFSIAFAIGKDESISRLKYAEGIL